MSLIPPDPTPGSVVDTLLKTAHQFTSIRINMIALGDHLDKQIRETAPDIGSDVSTFSRCLGELFDYWAGHVQAHDNQLQQLFPAVVRENEAQRLDLLVRIRDMAKRLKAAEAAIPSNNSVLMEHITGISAKVSSLADQWHKTRVPSPQMNGIFASVHAPSPDKKQAGGKGKKRPAIFGEEQPAKRQASVSETQRMQDPYAILRDWDWEKISAISSLMKVCNGRIPPESALAIAKAFEFRPREASPPSTLAPAGSYAAATAAPAASAGQPQGPPAPPTKASPPAQAKPKAPVVHVPARKDHTKLLHVPDVCEWARGLFTRYGKEANEVCGLHWHEGGVHVDIRFQTRPTVAARDYLAQELVWLANVQGLSRTATIDFYTPITRLAIRALRTHNPATQHELTVESIILAIKQENAWISECVLTHIQSPKPFWVNSRGGSGTFVFAAYDNRDGSESSTSCAAMTSLPGSLSATSAGIGSIPVAPARAGRSSAQNAPSLTWRPTTPDIASIKTANALASRPWRRKRCAPMCTAPTATQWDMLRPLENAHIFTVQDLLKNRCPYNGEVAVDVEKRRRLSGEGPAVDDAMVA
ncbi:hypothetical protein BC835DRAFT_1415949 [Cytidiella melzeri]|nr:hypothetical protein BC835DRAFT_1415949 [Cytidiella melzeri]